MKRHLAELALLYLCFYLPGFLVQTPDAIAMPRYMAVYITAAVPQALLLVYILWVQKTPALSDFGLTPLRLRDLLYALVLLAGLFAAFLAMGALVMMLPPTARDAFQAGFRWRLSGGGFGIAWWPLALLFCVATGYREELFFRSYLLTRFSSMGLAPAAAAASSAVLFAAGHAYQGIGGALFALVQGTIFAFAYYRKSSIHVLALAHALYNFGLLLLTAVGPGR